MKFFHDKGIGRLFGVAVALALVFPALNVYLVYPKFQDQMLDRVKHEARKVSRHLSRRASVDHSRLRIDFNREAELFLREDFGLIKIKVFDRTGTVIYSSDPKEVGQVNTHDYFRQEVAKGQEFTKIVAREAPPAEGKGASHDDVVETYLPIMESGVFAGAFELYYDISADQHEFNRIYFATLFYPAPLMLIFLGLVGLILKRLDNQIVARQRDKEEIEGQHALLLDEQEKQHHLLKHIEKAKRQWEATMDRVGDMVIVVDDEMRIRRCNKAVCAFSGLAFAEVLNQRLPDLLAGIEMEQEKSNGKALEYLHTESGRWFYVTLYKNEQGADAGWVVTVHDVTEIKKISAELERKNAEIVDNSVQLQRAVDEITKLINRVIAEEDFKVSFTYDLPEKCSEVMGCEQRDCPCYGQETGSCWSKAGTFCGGEVQGGFAQKYGSCRECAYFKKMTANPINMIGEQFNNMMHILAGKNEELQTAYTELKQTQSHLLQQEKMASIGQLAAGVAHEINNPVGFISSNFNSLRKYVGRLADFIAFEAGLVREAGDPALAGRQAEEQKKFKIDFILTDIEDLIRESLEGCERVKKIVQDLKGFSRVDQAKEQTVDIHECIDSTLNIVWNELKYKAKIDKDYQAARPLRCFPQQMNQVFMNLLVNAAHAIEKEGVITIRTWQDEAFAYVAISDTGSGIKPEHIGHVFEPFFTTKEVGKGTGLGLSIVYDIVTKNHHGDIQLESQVGRGTTFTVKIPFGEKTPS